MLQINNNQHSWHLTAVGIGMKKIKFDANGGSETAYVCSEPGDNTGWYYQSADVDDRFKEAANIIIELCDHLGICCPTGTLARLGVGFDGDS